MQVLPAAVLIGEDVSERPLIPPPPNYEILISLFFGLIEIQAVKFECIYNVHRGAALPVVLGFQM